MVYVAALPCRKFRWQITAHNIQNLEQTNRSIVDYVTIWWYRRAAMRMATFWPVHGIFRRLWVAHFQPSQSTIAPSAGKGTAAGYDREISPYTDLLPRYG